MLWWILAGLWPAARCGEARGPRFTQEPPARLEFSNSTGAVVPCRATEGTLVSWVIVRPDGVLDPAESVTGLREIRALDGALFFPPFPGENFRPEIHDTVYRCVARNPVGAISSRDARVRAVVVTPYGVEVYDDFVIAGNTGFLRCTVPSMVREYVEVTAWLKTPDGSALVPGERISIYPTGELHIRKVTPQDAAHMYHCETRHRLTGELVRSSKPGRLLLTEPFRSVPPRITDTRRRVRAKLGSDLELPCAAQGFPAPNYAWFRREGSSLQILGGRDDGPLVRRDLGPQDAGMYVCVVNNSAGVDRAETELALDEPLSIEVRPAQLTVDAGSTAVFNCTVLGGPAAVEWTRDLTPLRSSARVRTGPSSLELGPVARSDRGMYQCRAYGERGSAQDSVQLTIGDYAPTLLETFSGRTVGQGEAASLRCVATGQPLPQVTWVLDGEPVPESARVRAGDFVRPGRPAVVVSYVNISTARPEDGGKYECRADNEAGTARHARRLEVYGPPVVRPMPNVTAVAGDRLRLICPVGGHPILSIRWDKDSVRLPFNHRQKVDGNLLEVSQVERAADGGLYACNVRGPDGKLARGSTHVSVLVRPFIERFQFPGSLQEGQRFSVLCSVTRGDRPVEIRWSKDGRPLGEPGVRAVAVAEFSSSLVFEAVRPHHRGNYTCKASNRAGSVAHSAPMVIHVPPRWVVEPSDASVTKGSSARLDCRVEGVPVPRIQWAFSAGLDPASTADFEAVPQSDPHMQILGNGSLVLRGARRSDQGLYLCRASNGVGSDLSKMARLSVHVAVTFQSKFRAETVRKGEDVTLRCQAHGDLPITVRWMKDKQPLDFDMETRYEVRERETAEGLVSEVVIRQADRRDSALFSCHGSNRWGHEDSNTQLILQEPPDSPQEVMVKSQGSRTVRLAWSLPYSGNSPVLHYVVQYKEDKARWQDVSTVNVSGALETRLQDLHPTTTYDVRVLARNALGYSEPSHVIQIRTDEEAPGAPPEDVQAVAISSTSVRATWEAPKPEFHFGEARGYYVGYRRKGARGPETFVYKTLVAPEGQPAPREAVLTGLQRNTEYVVIVQMYNGKGAGPPSEESVVRTLDTDPPLPPVLKIRSQTNDSVSLSWERIPEDLNPVTGYTVHHRRSDSGVSWEETAVAGDSHNFTVHGLQCGTRYHFYVTAENPVGRSDPSKVVQHQTEGNAPVAPDKQSFLSTNASAAEVRLMAWKNGGCDIAYFSIRYRRRQESWVLVADRVSPERGSLVLRDLTSGTWYHLQVTAHNAAGVTQADYSFPTFPGPHGQAQASPAPGGRPGELLPFYADLTVILPAAISAAVILTLVVLASLLVRRRSLPRRECSDESEYTPKKSATQPSGESLSLSEFQQQVKKSLSNPQDPNSKYFPSPYATTRVVEDCGVDYKQCFQCMEEPLYATVKRTPRMSRQELHIYHYPANLMAGLSDDSLASTSHWALAEQMRVEGMAQDKNNSGSPYKHGGSHRSSHRYSNR